MLLRIILIGVLFTALARAFWLVVDGIVEGASGQRRTQIRPGMKLVRDPVCDTHVVPNPALSLTSGRATQYFCSEACRAKYRERS